MVHLPPSLSVIEHADAEMLRAADYATDHAAYSTT